MELEYKIPSLHESYTKLLFSPEIFDENNATCLQLHHSIPTPSSHPQYRHSIQIAYELLHPIKPLTSLFA